MDDRVIMCDTHIWTETDLESYVRNYYRSGTVNSKSFASKVLLRIKWKFELTVHFKHEILGQL